MLILYDLSRPKYFIQVPNPKSKFVQVLEILFLRIFTVTGRPDSTDTRPDPNPCSLERASRPGVYRDSTGPYLLLSGFSQSTDPVDRQAPTVGFLTVGGRPARSTGSLSKVLTDSTAIFSDSLTLGICLQRIYSAVFHPYK